MNRHDMTIYNIYNKVYKLSILILLMLTTTGCYQTKNIPEDEYLYAGIKELAYGHPWGEKRSKGKDSTGVITAVADAYTAVGDVLRGNTSIKEEARERELTPQEQDSLRRQEIIDEFDKAPAGAALVAQIQSGGTGLNIQSASVVILCEPQLKPSIENQAISRAYRMGQARSVLVYRLLCDDTIDERIIEILSAKQKEFDAFADESKAADDTLELDNASITQIMKEEQAVQTTTS